MKAIAATPRTISAIRRADALTTSIPGGEWRKGNVPQSGGGGSCLYPAKVLSKSGLYHLCDIYGNGIDNAATLEGQKVFILQLNLAETLTTGTWIMVSESQIGATGGGNVP